MKEEKQQQNIGGDVLELVIRELLAEQQESSKMIALQTENINQLKASISSLRDNENANKVILQPSTKLVEEIIKKGVFDMQAVAASQPKNVTRKFQFLLFPEQDAKLFYKIVFGRWLVLLVVMLLITDAYKWGIHYSDNQKELRAQELVKDQVTRAWVYLYHQQGKKGKRSMDSAYQRTYGR